MGLVWATVRGEDAVAETRGREGSPKERLRSSLTWSARWEPGGRQVHDGVPTAGRLRLLTSGAHLVPGISCLFSFFFFNEPFYLEIIIDSEVAKTAS